MPTTIPVFTGYIALSALIYLGEAGVPSFVLTELVLVAAGFASERHGAALATVLVLSWGADIAGTLSLYAMVRFARGHARDGGRLEKVLQRATKHARTLGASSTPRVALIRCVPLVPVPSACGAALVGLPARAYAIAATLGGAVWVTIFVGAGYLLSAPAFR